MAKRKILMEGNVQILPFTHVDCIVGDGKNLNELLAEKANAADLAGYVTTGMLTSQLGSYVTTDNFDNVKEALMAEDARIEREYKAADAALQTAISEKVSQSTYDEKMQAVDKAIADEVERSTEKDEAMEGAISGLETNLGEIQPVVEKLDGAVETEGSVKYQIAASEKTLNEKISQADSKISTALETIDTKLGGIEKAVGEELFNELDEKVKGLETVIADEVKSGLAEADAAAKAAQDDVDALEAIVGEDATKGLRGQVAALQSKDTELENAIGAKVEQSVYDAKVAELEGAHTTLQGAINAEKTRAEGVESGLDTRVTANANAIAAINDTKDGIYAKAVAEANRLDGIVRDEFAAADSALGERIDGVANDIAAMKNADTGILKQAEDYADGIKEDLQKEIDADVKVVADRVTPLETFVNNHDHKPMEDRLDALEELHKQGGVVDNKIAAVQGAVDAVEGRMDTAEGKLAVIEDEENGLLAQAKADAKTKDDAVRAAFKAVDDALEERIAANEAFVAAQPAIDKAQNDRLSAIEEAMGLGGGEEGTSAIDELKTDVQDAQNAADAAQEAADKAQGEVDVLEGVVNALDQAYKAADTQLQTNIDAVDEFADAVKAALDKEVEDREAADAALKTELQGEIDADVKVEKERAEGAEAALAGRLDVLEGTGENSVKAAANKALADAKSYADGKAQAVQNAVDGLEPRVKANEDMLAGIEEATVKAAIAAAEGRANANAADAKAAAEAAQADIDAFMAAAETGEAAVDTLKEIQKYITEDGQAAQALVGRVGANETAIASINNAETGILAQAKKYADDQDAALKSVLQKEIDDDVAAEKALREAEDAKVRQEFAAADATLQQAIDAVNNGENGILAQAKAYADAEDAKVEAAFAAADTALHTTISAEIDADVKAEADRAKEVEEDLGERIAAVEGTVLNGVIYAVDIVGDKKYDDIEL